MVETISHLRQLLNESKFVEAQKETELLLLTSDQTMRSGLLDIYFETLLIQSRELPPHLVIEHVDNIISFDPDKAITLLEALGEEARQRHLKRILCYQIKIAEQKGKNEDLYRLISELQILAYTRKTPNIPASVSVLSEKYFPGDFVLGLQRLALQLLTMDLESSEKFINDLIFSCIERSTPKRTKEKLLAVAEVLSSLECSSRLDIYKQLCHFLAEGVTTKQDNKRLIEMVIYADDFRLQTLVMALMDKLGYSEITQLYSEVLKGNDGYDFVYFDKFFPGLKKYFFKSPSRKVEQTSEAFTPMELSRTIPSPLEQAEPRVFDRSEEESLISKVLVHQNFNETELLDLAVGFLQAEFPWAALTAADLVLDRSTEDQIWLKGSYLKLTALLMLNDCRAAIDLSMESLQKAKTKDDVLSFMYCQAEAHYRLKDLKAARNTFQRIVSMDENYRLAKEKLEMLNEV